jgi:cephalosporin-C deacetylase-like acetyl esterase
MSNRLLIFLLAITAITAFGQAQGPLRQDLARRFDYDSKAPLDVREVGRERREGGVSIVDLTYASPLGGRVPAYVVVPDGRGPYAAILFGHWMMPGSPLMNRREFLEEAVVLARSGAISLLIDTPLVRPGFVMEKDELRAAVQSSETSRQQVIDFRRGLDLLTSRYKVRKNAVAYVGHSFDAHVGAILTGVEKRINSFVLMAGGYSDEEYVFDPENAEMLKLRQRLGDEALRDYFRKYAWDDPVHFISHSAPAAVFLQFGRQDKQTPEKTARRFLELFGEPKQIGFYDAGHALDGEARRDRAQWLRQRLGLKPVDDMALARIPQLK